MEKVFVILHQFGNKENELSEVLPCGYKNLQDAITCCDEMEGYTKQKDNEYVYERTHNGVYNSLTIVDIEIY